MKKKLNALDVFLIVLVVLILVGIATRTYFSLTYDERSNSDFYISLKAESVPPEKVAALDNEDNLTLIGSGEAIGKVSAIDQRSHTVSGRDGDGNEITYTDERKTDIMITVSVRGRMTDEGLTLSSGMVLTKGTALEVSSSSGFEGKVTVFDINDKNGAE